MIFFCRCGADVDVRTHWAGSHYVTRFLKPGGGDEVKRCDCGVELYTAFIAGELRDSVPEKICIGPGDV